jgi:hypothetical protein
MKDIIEVLIQKTLAQSTPCVCEQSIDGPVAKRVEELIHTGQGGQIGLDRNDRTSKRLNLPGRLIDRGFICGNDQVKAVFGALHGQFIAYAG